MQIELLTEKEIKSVLEFTNKDTVRKQKMYIKLCIKETIEFIEYLEQRLNNSKEPFAWYLGERYTRRDLNTEKNNLHTLNKFYKTI